MTQETETRISTSAVITNVLDEIIKTRQEKGGFQSTHEGLGVVLEEWEEFKDEVKADNNHNACEEAIQLAAAALNFVIDFKQPSGINCEIDCMNCSYKLECLGPRDKGCRRFPEDTRI